MKLLVAALSALMIVGCQTAPVAPASAVAAAVPETAESIQVAAAEGDVLCRSMKVTGTRFAKRECKTVAAWKEYDAYTEKNARESTDKFQRLNSGCSTQAQGTC